MNISSVGSDMRFADIQMLRYHLKGFDGLSLRNKIFIYYLAKATLVGRDITTDQNGIYNLDIIRVTAPTSSFWILKHICGRSGLPMASITIILATNSCLLFQKLFSSPRLRNLKTRSYRCRTDRIANSCSRLC